MMWILRHIYRFCYSTINEPNSEKTNNNHPPPTPPHRTTSHLSFDAFRSSYQILDIFVLWSSPLCSFSNILRPTPRRTASVSGLDALELVLHTLSNTTTAASQHWKYQGRKRMCVGAWSCLFICEYSTERKHIRRPFLGRRAHNAIVNTGLDVGLELYVYAEFRGWRGLWGGDVWIRCAGYGTCV